MVFGQKVALIKDGDLFDKVPMLLFLPAQHHRVHHETLDRLVSTSLREVGDLPVKPTQ